MAKQKPIGILLISHGDLSKHFLNAAKIIFQENLDFINVLAISSKQNRQEVLKQINNKITEISTTTDQIIVLCDTHGATPSRIVCANKYENVKVKCVFGLNLPMLLDCISLRNEHDLETLCDKICKTGQDAIFSKSIC